MGKAKEIAKNVVALPVGLAVIGVTATAVLVAVPLAFAWGVGRALIDLPGEIKRARKAEGSVIDAERVDK